MFIQQGVARHLMSYIERHPYTRGHVNFVDQTINGALALESSLSKRWATIDLSDASDRVSVQLVKYLFPREVSTKWLALRSTATRLPSGAVLRLNKFAPMGSALCFPVESLTFWALAVGYVWERTRDLHRALESVYVYGDDIIIADEYTQGVIETLEGGCLKVNRDKSFSGNCAFRESCGIEAVNGFDVTPLRLRALPPQRPSDGPAIASWLQYASNAAVIAPRRSAALERTVKELIGRIPRTPVQQEFLSIVDPNNFWSLEDFQNPVWDPALCYYRTRLYTLKTRAIRDPMDSFARLLKDLTVGAGEGDPSLVVDRLSTQIRKREVSITYLVRGGQKEV